MSELRSEKEISESWSGNHKLPKVSIRCATYNHEAYIEDALKGFLIQETDFPFEICIHDDASTDQTQEILKKYEKRYPSIIKVIYQTENQYSQGKKPGRIVEKICKGKYIAFCEGDDYWTDPKKLAVQVAYLDSHPNVVISSHDAFVVNEKKELVRESKLPQVYHRDYSSNELIKGDAWLLTMNMVYRNINLGFIPERYKVLNGDTFFTSLIGHYGDSHFHTDIRPSAYRVHNGGVWSSLSKREKIENHIQTYFWMYRYYKRVEQDEYSKVFFEKYKLATKRLMSDDDGDLGRQEFYVKFSNIYKLLRDLSVTDANFLVYGHGSFGKYIRYVLGSNVIGFIDRNYNGSDDSIIPIYSIYEIERLNFDAIVISLIGREKAVIREIESVLGVNSKGLNYIILE